MPPLVEIGLTDLPKSWGAMAPPAPPGTTPLSCDHHANVHIVINMHEVANKLYERTYLNMAVLVCISLCIATLQIYFK